MRAAILDGIVLGLQFGLLGVGLTLVYGLGGILNLAQGQIAVLGGIVVALSIDAGRAAGVAVLAGMAVAGAIGVVLDLTLMKPVYRERGERRVLLGLLLMLGVAFIIEGVLVWRYPIEALSLRIGGDPVRIVGVGMRPGQLLASAIALVAGGLLHRLRPLHDTRQGSALGHPARGGRPTVRHQPGQDAHADLRSERCPRRAVRGDEIDDVTGNGDLGHRLHDPRPDRRRRRWAGQRVGVLLAGILLGVVNTVSVFYIGSYITTIVLLLSAAITIVIRPSSLLGLPR